MEIEFDVKMNSSVLYDYMLHHAFNSFSGILGAAMGALLIIAFFGNHYMIYLICGLILMAFQPVALFFKSKKQMVDNPVYKNPIHYLLNDEGITVSQGETVQTVSWRDISKATSSPKSIILYTGKIRAWIFPRKDLGEDSYKVIEIISTHVPAKYVRIRQ